MTKPATLSNLTHDKMLNLKYEATGSDRFKDALHEAGVNDLAEAFEELMLSDQERIESGRMTQNRGRLKAIHAHLWKMQIEMDLEPTAHPDTIFPLLTIRRHRKSRWHTIGLEQMKVVNETDSRVTLWSAPGELRHESDVSQAYAFIPHGEYQHAQALLAQVEEHYSGIRKWFQARGNFYNHPGETWENAIQFMDTADVDGLEQKGEIGTFYYLNDFRHVLPWMNLVEVVKVHNQMVTYRSLEHPNDNLRAKKRRFYPCTTSEFGELLTKIQKADLAAAAFDSFMASIPSYEKLRHHPSLLSATEPMTSAGGALDDALLLEAWSGRYRIANSKVEIISGKHAGAQASIVDSFGLGPFRRIVVNLDSGSQVTVWNSEAKIKEASTSYQELLNQGPDTSREILLTAALLKNSRPAST